MSVSPVVVLILSCQGMLNINGHMTRENNSILFLPDMNPNYLTSITTFTNQPSGSMQWKNTLTLTPRYTVCHYYVVFIYFLCHCGIFDIRPWGLQTCQALKIHNTTKNKHMNNKEFQISDKTNALADSHRNVSKNIEYIFFFVIAMSQINLNNMITSI